MKPNIQTLYARILEDIRAEMDDAEMLYLMLCRTAISGMMQTAQTDPAAGQEIDHLSARYREKLQAIIRDVSMVWRDPIRVFPLEDHAPVLDMLETYNAQF